MLLSALLTAALVAGANAIPTSSLNVMESLREVPQGWKNVGRPSPSKRLQFRISLNHPNDALFEQTLYDMSTPGHENYGKHLKRDELKAMLRPNVEATEAVFSWLQNAGVEDRDIVDDGEWINFVTTASQAETMLDTEFGIFRNAYRIVDTVRTLHYSVPAYLHEYIDMIQPTTRFGMMKPEISEVFDVKKIGKAGSALNATACNTTITPQCLFDLYSIPQPAARSLNNQSVGFAAFNNFLEEYPRYDDLATFESLYAPFAEGESFGWTSIDGGLLDQNSTSNSVEANLDVQYLLSVGYPVPIEAYSTAGRGPIVTDLDQPDAATAENEPYLDFLTYILAQADDELPHTITTSYGEDEQSVPLKYRKTVCKMFGQLGARGVSVLFSSGDTGVGSACQTNDGKNTTRFLPIFPAACPYVTSVGATRYVEPESAVSFSSGGFSDTWTRPSYQDKAVKKYLDILGDTWEGLYNPEGRGFPDVAAQGVYFHVIDSGDDARVSGTSASSPAFAGVVALLNAERIKAGKSPLGFLNPWIYSDAYKHGLTDIVNGGSRGCTGIDEYSGLPTPIVIGASWNATTGWDPVTGYGTPYYPGLLKSALKQ